MVLMFAVSFPLIARAVPTPEPEIEPVPPPTKEESVYDMVVTAFPDAPIMVDIARAESQFIATAKNPKSTATGVFQILIGTWEDPAYGCTGDRMNPRDNIACARKIYDVSGVTPWLDSKGMW